MKTIKEDSTAPEFELPDQDGKTQRLSDLLLNGPVVLFWYPAAMTGGCTQESCRFRDLKSEFEAAGAQRIGISMDSVAKQQQFADAHGFDYPLLSDESGEVAVAYGVRRKYVTPVKRAHVRDRHRPGDRQGDHQRAQVRRTRGRGTCRRQGILRLTAGVPGSIPYSCASSTNSSRPMS